jgi:hypothetical protein
MLHQAQGNWAAKLRRFATVAPSQEHCELCGATIGSSHAHLLEVANRRLFCACEACDRALGESERFRALRPKTEVLAGFKLSDWDWEAMQLPIDLVFFFLSTPDGGPVALYPGAAGAMASAMGARAWARLASTNPVLNDMAPDVEALLINRVKGARQYYRVSIDRCHALVGLIRKHWTGISGGAEVWDQIARFFAALESPGDSNFEGTLAHG